MQLETCCFRRFIVLGLGVAVEEGVGVKEGLTIR